jgi:hypothetical protein
MTPTSPPRGLFKNRNIMTPNILGYYKLRGKDVYVELSEGRGIQDQPIWGVTVRPDEAHKLSKLCYSRREAEAYIESLS